MTADAPPRRSYRTFVLASLAALVGAHAAGACTTRCDGVECTDTSDARLLDRVCSRSVPGEGPACEVDAGAVKSTGITGDSLGFHLGDTGGKLIFHLAALDGVQVGNRFDVELLMASTNPEGSRIDAVLDWGSCAVDCPQNPPIFDTTVTPEYHWIPVVLGQDTSTAPSLPYNAVLSLTGKSIDIADLRVSSITPEFACSLARPLGAR